MSNSLLEKAQRDYPIGTEYIGIRDGDTETVIYTPRWIEGQDGNIEGGRDYIYCDGEWAKIVTPKKFDIGKWYRNIRWQSKAGKVKSYNDDRVSFSEYISSEGEHMYFNFENPSSDTFIEVPLSEIQQYLPINHPDNKQENKTVMIKQILTVAATDVLRIHRIACSTWKDIIVRDYLPRVGNDQNITFTQHEIDAMFKCATETQLPVLENIFGKQVKETLKDIADGKPLFREDSYGGTTAMVEVRIGGSDLKDKAFWLNTTYNWELKKDNEGVLCLVPTPKK